MNPGIKLSVFVDIDEVEEGLDALVERSRRMSPAFRELRPMLARDQVEHAKGEEGPDGAWAPRSAATLESYRRRKKRRRITKAMRSIAPAPLKHKRRSMPKQILGRLPKATVTTSGNLWARAESRAKIIGGANQHGGMVGRKRKVKLKARPFIWLSKKFLHRTRSVLARHIIQGWPGYRRAFRTTP